MENIEYCKKVNCYECTDVSFVQDFLKSQYIIKDSFKGQLDYVHIIVRDLEGGYRSELFLIFIYKNLKDFVDDFELGGQLRAYAESHPSDSDADLMELRYSYVSSSRSRLAEVDLNPADDSEEFENFPLPIQKMLTSEDYNSYFPKPEVILQTFINTYLKNKARI